MRRWDASSPPRTRRPEGDERRGRRGEGRERAADLERRPEHLGHGDGARDRARHGVHVRDALPVQHRRRHRVAPDRRRARHPREGRLRTESGRPGRRPGRRPRPRQPPPDSPRHADEAMCDLHEHALEPLEHDEWVLDTPLIRGFVGACGRPSSAPTRRPRPVGSSSPASGSFSPIRIGCRAGFRRMRRRAGWAAASANGCSSARPTAPSACSASSCRPGSMTPVHDHLAWGLVGLYKGNQDEEFYEPGHGRLRLVRQRPLQPGDYYALLPPRDDVHRVRTTSDVTSVSIHLLANDTGCVLRHTFDQQTGRGEAVPLGLRERRVRRGDRRVRCRTDHDRAWHANGLDRQRPGAGDSLALRAGGRNGLAQARARLRHRPADRRLARHLSSPRRDGVPS